MSSCTLNVLKDHIIQGIWGWGKWVIGVAFVNDLLSNYPSPTWKLFFSSR